MTTALYRRYRPETFAEVIGQEHVTAPLMQALRSGRVNHAYLFSGPRGCGKTTSARILARTLNCARNTPETPLDTPCGECPSCVELARGGPGSLDVVEIDAASHNGVDDARDLRERATFAPARDRYKIFILDEAHMVTPQGFNALLKIVEEPPPHVKFVFATTEPDKVIGTIRSRTHHYPFRLVPPDVLGPYLEQLTAAEGIELGGGVVPLVTRAGGGSVRDSLSVLDQLIAGATDGVVEYDTAVGLLGFTHATLLDDVVDALAAGDGASIFRVVDQVIATGHEPRRFVEDVLERLRDLIVIAVSGDAAEAVLRGLPADQLERMRAQAGRLGVSELSRAADLVNAALTEMTGATSPRLHLELLCARLLLPGADDGTEGLAARIERLERGRIAAGDTPVPAAPRADRDVAPTPAPQSSAGGGGGLSGAAAARAALQASRRPVAEPEGAAEPEPTVPQPEPVAEPESSVVEPVEPSATVEREPAVDELVEAPATVESEPAVDEPDEPDEPDEAAEAAEPDGPDEVEEPAESAAPAPVEPVEATPSTEPAPEPAPSAPASAVTTEVVRRRWREVLTAIQSPQAAAFLGENAQVKSLEGDVLRLGFAPAVVGLARRGRPETISDAVYQALGIAVQVEIVEDVPGRRPREAGSAPAPSDPGADAAEEPDDSGRPADPAWPDVPPPGEGRSGGGGGATAGGPGPGAGPRPSATTVAATGSRPATAVAVVDPPAPSAPRATQGAPRTPQPQQQARQVASVDEADAAWLAGVSLHEPPPDDLPEPPLDEPVAAPVARPVAPPRPAPETPPVASAPAAAPASSSPPAPAVPPARETPRQAAERRVREAQQSEGRSSRASASGGNPADDEPSADDPDIASAGLVGVQLVVQVLDGKVIEEIAEQP
ncbi:DNA polymerase III subunit gamma and tau [Isoptericola sp. NPDC056134]|uniref:DNA polymerase III subunit gamma and tau n=1 Tax=Isoptericola sp. NPDC056134 TaxID=3345723 RepID=UPI0035E77517